VCLKLGPGNDLPSQGPSPQVLSALESLTSVFGMGTGVTSPPLSPGNFLTFVVSKLHSRTLLKILLGQVLDLLVPVSFRHCCPSTSGLSTRSSLWSLNSFCCGKSYLEEGFALRCFQRLSLPDIATQLYPWQDNWYTRGLSIPVLSY
jgi:hypothetical protein